MKKKILAGLATGLFLLCVTGMANAALVTIGTATYDGSNYNLIWDDNNNGNSVVWLDYTHGYTNWSAQNAWAAELDSVLTYNIDAAYSVAWDAAAWRLPSAGAHPQSGINKTTSEMGDLYYNELGLTSYPHSTQTELNASNFDHLIASFYWSGTEDTDFLTNAWYFYMASGSQHSYTKARGYYGLAVRSGQVSAVPVPGAIWLLGSGLACVVALGRRRKGNRV